MTVAVQEQQERSDYLGTKPSADLASVSVPTWERLKAAGRLPPHVVITPKIHRWRKSDILLWLEWNCPDRKTFEAMKAAKK
jgi:predicted DNA-binding transcriptional regulator AlpA